MAAVDKRALFEYYDQRAPEYELIYTHGGGPASISDRQAYMREAEALARFVREQVGRIHVDLACGTGFWLSYYHDRCDAITLVDQSRNMLSECERKIAQLGIAGKTELVHADVFEYPFSEGGYESALVGFLLSHLTTTEETALFRALKRMLRPEGRFVILDSVWSGERAATRAKDGSQLRKLEDGRLYSIPKRYFTSDDLQQMARRHHARLRVAHSGKVFIAACGSFE